MVGDISERSFENAIEQELLRHGQDAPAGGGLVGAKLSPYGDVPGAIAVAGRLTNCRSPAGPFDH